MNICKRTILLFVLLTLFACGKKTDPVPVSSLEIPVPSGIGYSFTEEGIRFSNPDTRNPVAIHKASFDVANNCAGQFVPYARLLPGGTFTDTAVDQGLQYAYEFRTFSIKHNYYSEPKSVLLRYSIPLEITEVTSTLDNLTANITYKTDYPAYALRVFLNGKPYALERDNPFTVAIPADTLSVVTLIPVDEFKNDGIPKMLSFQMGKTSTVQPVSVLRIVHNSSNIVVSWDKVEGADKYIIYKKVGDEYQKLAETRYDIMMFPMPEEPSCITYAVSSVTGAVETQKAEISRCFDGTGKENKP